MTDDLTREHERALLARSALLGGAHTARNLLDMVQAPMLADARLARAWSALRRVLASVTGPIDLIDALAAELSGDADALSLADLHQLATAVPSAANASYYAQRVIDHFVRRQARCSGMPKPNAPPIWLRPTSCWASRRAPAGCASLPTPRRPLPCSAPLSTMRACPNRLPCSGVTQAPTTLTSQSTATRCCRSLRTTLDHRHHQSRLRRVGHRVRR